MTAVKAAYRAYNLAIKREERVAKKLAVAKAEHEAALAAAVDARVVHLKAQARAKAWRR